MRKNPKKKTLPPLQTSIQNQAGGEGQTDNAKTVGLKSNDPQESKKPIFWNWQNRRRFSYIYRLLAPDLLPNWFMLAVNIALAIFTYRLFKLTNEQMIFFKESIKPIIGVDITKSISKSSFDFIQPEIIVKNYGSSVAKNVKIFVRADFRYADIPNDSVTSYIINGKSLGDIRQGESDSLIVVIPEPLQEKKRSGEDDKRILFLHIKIVYMFFNDTTENPLEGISIAYDTKKREKCKHNGTD